MKYSVVFRHQSNSTPIRDANSNPSSWLRCASYWVYKKTRTTSYHPQSDGLVKRWNRTLLQSLATSLEDHPENWDEFVRQICMAYNTRFHPTTGFTPFYLMFGRQAKLPVELMYGTPETETMPPSQYGTQSISRRRICQSKGENTKRISIIGVYIDTHSK